MINGLRLKQVREFLGLTQSELALKLDVNQSSIAYIEGGYLQPSDELMQAICEHTGFPQDFFELVEVTEFPLGSLLYRSRTSVDASERTRVNRYGQFMFEVADRLAGKLKYPSFNFPKGRIDPITAARVTRSNLHLAPDTPIDDLIYELEQKGVFIFRSPVAFTKIEAFAAWAGYDEKKPVIVLTGDVPADRNRHSVAHELGHLILHSTLFGDIQEFEREADMFAAELLLPEEAMQRLIIGPLTLNRVLKIKADWKVSVQAIVRRAHELNLITDSNYKSLFVQISQQKKKLQDMFATDIPEKPRCLRIMAETVYGKKINYRQFSKDTHYPMHVLKQFILAQADQEEYTRQVKADVQKGKVLKFTKDKNYEITHDIDVKEQ